MIVKEHPYMDNRGNLRDDLVKYYSDLGVRLLQVDTGMIYADFVIDSVYAKHEYVELLDDLGTIPEDMYEPEEERRTEAE